MISLVRSRVLLVAFGAAWIGSANADLLGASVTGDLRYPVGGGAYNAQNLFDPAYFGVPPGYGNSASATIVLSGAGQDNFAWLQGGGTIEEPGIDSWFAEFDGTQLRVIFRRPYYPWELSGARLQFQSDAFVGLAIQQVGVDAFLSAGNGPMTATVDGDTITLTVAEQCSAGAGCLWPDATYSNTYALAPIAEVAQLTLRSSVVAGCKSVVGTVTLGAPAPAGGVIVTLGDTLASATLPPSLTIPSGASSGRFTIKTVPVLDDENGFVNATVGGEGLNQPLRVRRIGLSSLTLKPGKVAGGNAVAGKATLECKAGPGPITVDLSSSDSDVAETMAPGVVVPQGAQSVAFDVTTSTVLSASSARITGSANDIAKSKVLKVLPAASVGPTSLKFGNQQVGTTSAALNATLTNAGTAAFAITSIALSGNYAAWFAQGNDCPANLAPGASCTIGVTFTPAAAAARSAKLSIATSATATPLNVSLSGTGILP